MTDTLACSLEKLGGSPADPIYDLISKDTSYEGSILDFEKHHLSLCNMKLFQHLALY